MIKKVFILLGNDKTGKTTFQKELIYHLTGVSYSRLPSSNHCDIVWRDGPYDYLYCIGRSIQEKEEIYTNLELLINNLCQTNKNMVAILSSHLNEQDINNLLSYLNGKIYRENIVIVTFSNCPITEPIQTILDKKGINQYYRVINPIVSKNWLAKLSVEADVFMEKQILR